jgi:hypothetical protein
MLLFVKGFLQGRLTWAGELALALLLQPGASSCRAEETVVSVALPLVLNALAAALAHLLFHFVKFA